MLIFLLYNKSSVVAEMGDRLATINIGRREGAAVPLFGGGEMGPIKHDVAWAEIYLRIKWHLDPSSRLATVDMGRKLGAVPFYWGGELGPHLTQCGLGQGLSPCQV